ncbi:hypothetical protein SAY86_012990 [Trapa natans]|uniref:Uncharacterized protein n=1 Tax=Trapa natans TaxID=22666 RepID=A0AAN7LXM0_TRANT|nr:hypothetical protein SAY86_012990 [Trapa natans]
MNLLWSLVVSCYGGSGSCNREAAGPRVRPTEDAGSLGRQRRRVRSGHREWTPTLCSIMEDKAVMTGERVRGREKMAAAAVKRWSSARAVRSSGSESGARVHDRRHSDDYGEVSMGMAIHAFSPTPFMF